MKILSFLYWVHTQDILFDALEYQQRYCKTVSDLDDASDNESIMMKEQEMENKNYDDDSDHDHISTEML